MPLMGAPLQPVSSRPLSDPGAYTGKYAHLRPKSATARGGPSKRRGLGSVGRGYGRAGGAGVRAGFGRRGGRRSPLGGGGRRGGGRGGPRYGGGGPGGAGGVLGDLGPGPAALTELSADPQPDVQFGIGGLKDLLAGGQGEQRAVERLGGNIRDWQARTTAGMLPGQAARGVTGTGAEGLQAGRVASEASRAFAGGAADIEAGRLTSQQSVLRDIMGGGVSQAGIQQGDKAQQLQLARSQLSNWQAKETNARSAENNKIRAAMEALSFVA